jgi:hypothetical protein
VLGIDEPREGLLLDIAQVGDIEDFVEAREGSARAGSSNRSQDGDSSGAFEGGQEGISALSRSRKRDHAT